MANFQIFLLVCVLQFGFCFSSNFQNEQDIQFEDGRTLKFGRGIPDNQALNDEDNDDFIEHDCKTIKPLTKENLENEKWFKPGRKVKNKKGTLKKYNHAYGIIVAGDAYAKDETMLRACYLMRYLFADNEHMRRMAYKQGMYVLAEGGGVCCPARMGNQGLSCSCSLQINSKGNMKTNKFPFNGIGSPAHEAAHYFIGRILAVLARPNKKGETLMKLPEFVEHEKWKWQKVTGPQKCKKLSKKEGALFDFLWNSWGRDRAQTPPSTKIEECKWHHYFIYTGQEKYLLNSGRGERRKQNRAQLLNENPNLHNVLREVWPCNNEYIPVCKDGSFQFTAGLHQKLKIGKADPNNPSKMICKDIDTREVSKKSPCVRPTNDVFDIGKEKESKAKCLKVARIAGLIPSSYKGREARYNIKEGEAEKKLADETEHVWYLQRCCAKTAKFKEAL